MIYPSLTFLFAAAVFLAVIVTLALRSQSAQRVVTVVVICSALLGVCFYGFGYGMSAVTPQEAFVAACRAIFSTTFMFVGRENYSELCRVAPWFAQRAWLQIIFWLAHMAAMYATASTVLSTIGVGLLRLLRGRILPLCRVCILYTGGGDMLSRARELSALGYRPLIIYSGDEADAAGMAAASAAADAAGGVMWPQASVTEDGAWLARLGIRPGRRKLELLCLNGDDGQTMEFLLRAVSGIQARHIDARQIHICVVCQSEANFDFLARTELDGGRRLAADVYTTAYLSAARLIGEAGPYKTLDFDGDGRARGDFSALIVGFGSVGQNMLRLLVRSAQFTGSRFSAWVVDKELDGRTGAFSSLYGDMLERYDITLRQADARSHTFMKLLDQLAPELKYIVVCTGDRAVDQEIANQLCTCRMYRGASFSPRLVLAVCSRDTVTVCGSRVRRSVSGGESAGARETDRSFPVLRLGELLDGGPDRLARAVNAIYLRADALRRFPEDAAAREELYDGAWYSMSNISRMSCRAAAASIPALLASAGVPEGDGPGLEDCLRRLRAGGALKENLSQTEHLRWNAFQASIGVRRMPLEEFERRIATAAGHGETALAALAALAEAGAPVDKRAANEACAGFRAAYARARKDIPSFGVGGVHACLAPWDELDALWALYAPLERLRRRVEDELARALGEPSPEAPEDLQGPDFKMLDSNNVEGLLAWLADGRVEP